MAQVLYENYAITTLKTSAIASDTVIEVTGTKNFPVITDGSGDWFWVTIIKLDSITKEPYAKETVRVTATNGSLFTIERSAGGDTALDFNPGDHIAMKWCKELIDDLFSAKRIADLLANDNYARETLAEALATDPEALQFFINALNDDPDFEDNIKEMIGDAFCLGDLCSATSGQILRFNAITNKWGVADLEVDTNEIADGAITTPKLADGAVTEAKLADAVAAKLNDTLDVSGIGTNAQAIAALQAALAALTTSCNDSSGDGGETTLGDVGSTITAYVINSANVPIGSTVTGSVLASSVSVNSMTGFISWTSLGYVGTWTSNGGVSVGVGTREDFNDASTTTTVYRWNGSFTRIS